MTKRVSIKGDQLEVELGNVVDSWIIPMFAGLGFGGTDDGTFTFQIAASKKEALLDAKSADKTLNKGNGSIFVKHKDSWWWAPKHAMMTWGALDYFATLFDEVYRYEGLDAKQKPIMRHVISTEDAVALSVGDVIATKYSIAIDMGEDWAADNGRARFIPMFGGEAERDDAIALAKMINSDMEGCMIAFWDNRYWVSHSLESTSLEPWAEKEQRKIINRVEWLRRFTDDGKWEKVEKAEDVAATDDEEEVFFRPKQLHRLLRPSFNTLQDAYFRLDRSRLDTEFANVLVYHSGAELVLALLKKAEQLPGRNRKAIVDFLDENYDEMFPELLDDDEDEEEEDE